MATNKRKTATRMRPSTNSVPFATVILPAPLIAKIERGWRDLEVNYNLRGLLRSIIARTPTGYIFSLYVVEAKGDDVLTKIQGGLKPLVTVTNATWAGFNKFLTMAGSMVAKKYGQAEAKVRKTSRAA